MSLPQRTLGAGLGAVVSLALLGGPGVALPLEFPGPAVADRCTDRSAGNLQAAAGALGRRGGSDAAVRGGAERFGLADRGRRADHPAIAGPIARPTEGGGLSHVCGSARRRPAAGSTSASALDVLDEPDMHVDLGDFRFLAAERDGPDGPEAVSLFVSRSADMGFVQMITIGSAINASAADRA